MARVVKCKYCGKSNSNEEMHPIQLEGKGARFKYYCNEEEFNQHELEIEEKLKLKQEKQKLKELQERQKKIESEKRTILIEFIMEKIVHFDPDTMIFPTSVNKYISEIRTKHDYDVILEAFKQNQQTLEWACNNYNLIENGFAMSRYFKTVIDDSLNKVASQNKAKAEAKRRLDAMQKKQQEQQETTNSINSYEKSQKKEFKNVKKTSGFMDFLGDDIV